MPISEAPHRSGKTPKLQPLAAKTLVDQVVEAIVEATATGVYLPGDRIVEAEVARSLNVSRVPVREALRLLESQGIVVNERYRGMRLMSVNIDRLEKILKVRLALENYACREIAARAATNPDVLSPLEDLVRKQHAAAQSGDGYGLARLDTEFHHSLCKLSGNEVLVRAWEPLSRQLTIIFGLSTLRKDLEGIASEHDQVIDALRKGDVRNLEKVMEEHILEYSRAIDYEGLVEQLRLLERRN